MTPISIGGPATELSWPLLSTAELRRLRFLAYLRRTGRIRPPAPVSAETNALCASLLSDAPALPSAAPRGQRSRATVQGGLPPLWYTWAETQRRA